MVRLLHERLQVISQELFGSSVPVTEYDDHEIVLGHLIDPLIDQGDEINKGRYIQFGHDDYMTEVLVKLSKFNWSGVVVDPGMLPVRIINNSTLFRCMGDFCPNSVFKTYPPPYDLVIISLGKHSLRAMAELICFSTDYLPRVLCATYTDENMVEAMNKRVRQYYTSVIRTKRNIICRK